MSSNVRLVRIVQITAETIVVTNKILHWNNSLSVVYKIFENKTRINHVPINNAVIKIDLLFDWLNDLKGNQRRFLLICQSLLNLFMVLLIVINIYKIEIYPISVIYLKDNIIMCIF